MLSHQQDKENWATVNVPYWDVDISTLSEEALTDFNDKYTRVSVILLIDAKNGRHGGQFHFRRCGFSIYGKPVFNPTWKDHMRLLQSGIRVAQCYDKNMI